MEGHTRDTTEQNYSTRVVPMGLQGTMALAHSTDFSCTAHIQAAGSTLYHLLELHENKSKPLEVPMILN